MNKYPTQFHVAGIAYSYSEHDIDAFIFFIK